MARGIIYIMTSVVPGLIKIGKTGHDNYEQRMYGLEHNGYRNVTGLRRVFAIEVEDYDEKEAMLQSIFAKSRLADTELFALDINIARQLLSSFDGVVVYPKTESKEEVFSNATNNLIPNGTYYLKKKVKLWNNNIVQGTLRVEDGKIIIQKGSICCPIRGNGWTTTKIIDKTRETCSIVGNVLQEDIECTSVSIAAAMLTWRPENGWKLWKDIHGHPIDIYRNKGGEN